ncbi:MAG: hypothetical protein ACJ741_10675 [Pyrinomonadaceae bacterium]
MESVEKRELIAAEGGRAKPRGELRDEEPARTQRGALAAVFNARTVYLAVGALVIGVAVGYLQFSTRGICCGDFDGYYHIRWSQLLVEGLRHRQFPPQFTWLPLTTLNPRDYVDHHLLFHLLEAPFTQFGNEILGAKISAWLFASLAIFSCYWLIVRHKVQWPLLWLAALLGSSAPFLFRMNMTKAMSVSVVLLVVGINLLFRRKYLWLLPLAFVFALTYDMWLLLGLAALVWAIVVGWSEWRADRRSVGWAFAGVAAVAVGGVLGYVVNPYFPHNLRLFYEHVVMKLAVSDPSRPSVGNEWYPYESWTFLANCAVAFLAMLVGYVTFRWEDRRRAAHSLFFLVFATLLLVANAKWRRYAEFFPPFAVLFAAFSVQALFGGARTMYGRLPEQVLDELRPFLDRGARGEDDDAKRESRWHRAEAEAALIAFAFVAPVIIIYDKWVVPYTTAHPHSKLPALLAAGAALIFTIFLAVHGVLRGTRRAVLVGVFTVLVTYTAFTVRWEGKNEIADSAAPEDYRAGIEWIRANVPPGETVFNTDWDDFPKLFFYDPTHAYVSGLDPTYLYDYDQNHELSKLYEQITLGKEKDPGPLIRDRFGARYVFSDTEEVHDDFYDAALDSGWFDEVYSDDKCTVLHIRDRKGAPPPDKPDADDGGGDGTSEPDDNTTNVRARSAGDQLALRR